MGNKTFLNSSIILFIPFGVGQGRGDGHGVQRGSSFLITFITLLFILGSLPESTLLGVRTAVNTDANKVAK